MKNLPRVLHLISGLGIGGAEMMLYQLVTYSQRKYLDNFVISMTEPGPVGERLLEFGVPVHCLQMKRGMIDLGGVSRLRKWLQENEIDVVQTWMYHANVLGSLVVRQPVVWGIHHTTLVGGKSKWLTVMTNMIGAVLSHSKVKRIIYCAESARSIHEKQGYMQKKGGVIANGFDTEKFRPDPEARSRLISFLGVEDTTRLKIIGHVGRYDPQKDYATLIKSFGLVVSSYPEAHFILCGRQLDDQNVELAQWITKANLDGHIHLLGVIDHVERIMPAFDVFALSSAYGEAFPMVLGEAMSCGVPCVSTDVGDAAILVGETGRIVAIKSPERLSEALLYFLTLSSVEINQSRIDARNRIVQSYELSKMLNQYIITYQDLIIG